MTDQDSGRGNVVQDGNSAHEVRDERQARLLLDPESLRFFRPFLARERTVSQAAAEVNCAPSVMLYRVGTFLRAGLLEIVREEPRRGRPMKIYRSTHDEYFIPYALTPHATLEEAFLEVFEANYRRVARAVAELHKERWDGYRLTREPDGSTWLRGVPDAERRLPPGDASNPGIDYALVAHLSPTEAQALQAELADLLQRFQGREEPSRAAGERRYLLAVAFVEERA